MTGGPHPHRHVPRGRGSYPAADPTRQPPLVIGSTSLSVFACRWMDHPRVSGNTASANMGIEEPYSAETIDGIRPEADPQPW